MVSSDESGKLVAFGKLKNEVTLRMKVADEINFDSEISTETPKKFQRFQG